MQSFKGRLLIVDDEKDVLAFHKCSFEEHGFRVDLAENLEQMEELILSYAYDVIILDMHIGSQNGLDALPLLISKSPFAKIFMLTANGSIDAAVEAVKKGADGFIEKSESVEAILQRIDKVLRHPPPLKEGLSFSELAEVGLIGESPAFVKLCENIQRLRGVDSTVLILGESGTGKEVVARTLHRHSPRSKDRFAAINCAAIPEALLESELFGHKRGAFTDAKSNRTGIFELCSEGTLLLDEIGDMPLGLQAKLLRVLQEKVIVPVGGSQPVNINTRVIAATHRDLREEIQNGRFREDLFYRLSVVPLVVPPLRHRKSDIPVLTRYFIELLNVKFNKEIKIPGMDFMKRLMAHDWPGNIRELRNSIERAMVLAPNDELQIEDLFQHLSLDSLYTGSPTAEQDSFHLPGKITSLNFTEAKQIFEKEYISEVLKATNGNITEASKRAGRYRADIYRLIDKYNLSPTEFR